jgi:predicted DNA-binding transcriptional regulator AlpA
VAKPKIKQQQRASSVDLPTAVAPGDDDPLTAQEAAAFVGLSLPAFWKQVAATWLPEPYYPAPRAPRWRRGTLRDACDARQQMPRLQKEQRRQARLIREHKAAASGAEPPP